MKIRSFLEMEMHSEPIHGGQGLCSHGTVFDGAEIDGPVSFLNHTILPPGASFGLHKHGRDNEFYIVLRGEGLYRQEEEQAPVKRGDVIMNAPFAAHAIENTGSEEMELLVLEVTF